MAVYTSLEIANKDDSCEEDDGRPKRTGTIWTCNAHIITGVIGSGILSLAWSTAQLGWVAGPISMVSFAIVTYISASLLSDCYRSPDPVTGTRNYTYVDAVNAILGQKRSWLCGYLQYLSMFGGCVAYVITASISIGAIHRSNCYHKQGHEAPCVFGDTFYMLLFGAIQVVFSQIPNFHHMEWLSIVAAIMSFTYATIGFSLGFFRVIENESIMGSLGGVPQATTAQKLWKICQAVGDIAFAYPYTGILLEIQDTLPSPPAENKTMKEASKIAISVTTFFYLFCGCFGYAAFGNQTPGNLLTGFGFYEPYWLIDLANVCIIVHLVGGYQVFSQPVFAFIEGWLEEKFPDSEFINKSYTVRVPFFSTPLNLNLLKLRARTLYVVLTTIVAMTFPYFNQVLGVLGTISFWPLTIYFPVQMYFVQLKVEAWTRKWIILQVFSIVCFFISTIALIGCFQGIVSAKLE